MSGSGSTPKGRARRAEILATALRVLADRGYRDTSLRAIGRELGVQPAQIIHYFATREALLEAVIAAWDEEHLRSIEEGDPFLDRWLEAVRRNTEVAGLVHLYTAFAAEAADARHPSHEFFRGRSRTARDLIAADLRAGVEAGRYRLALPEHNVAAILVSLSDGLQLQWLINPELDMVGELRAAMTRLTGHPGDSGSRET